MKKQKLTEVQKAAEWVRFARTNHAIYGDTSTEAELIEAIKSFETAQKEQDIAPLSISELAE